MKGLIDSTLREGSQTFGLTISQARKKAIFAGLCRVGIEEIEIGSIHIRPFIRAELYKTQFPEESG